MVVEVARLLVFRGNGWFLGWLGCGAHAEASTAFVDAAGAAAFRALVFGYLVHACFVNPTVDLLHGVEFGVRWFAAVVFDAVYDARATRHGFGELLCHFGVHLFARIHDSAPVPLIPYASVSCCLPVFCENRCVDAAGNRV